MDMVSRGIIKEHKQLFNQRYIDVCDITGKGKKLWLRESTAERKCGKWRM